MVKRLFRIFLLSIAICLTLPCAAWGEDYLHEATGVLFPETLATLKRGRVADFESDHPGLGIGINYDGTGIRVTIYAYTSGMEVIPEDLNSPVLREHFRQIIGDVMQAEKRGWIQNLEKISEGEIIWDETRMTPKSLHASFRFVKKGSRRLSHIYLMAYKNHFIKVRLSYDKTDQAALENLQKKILGELGNILNEVSRRKQTKRPKQKFDTSYVSNMRSSTSSGK